MYFEDTSLNFLNIASFQAHTDGITRIKQSPFNYDYVATCSRDFKVKMWDFHNWQLIRNYTGHSNQVWSLEYIDEDFIASGSWDQTIQLWSISTGQTRGKINTGVGVDSLQLLSNGFYLAAGLSNGQIQIFNINTGSLVFVLNGHSSFVNDFVLIGNNLLASSSKDATVRIWDLVENRQKFILNDHNSYIWGLKLVSLDTLASSSSDKTLKFWNTTNGTLIRTLMGHASDIYLSIDLTNDYNEETLVSGSLDKTIKFWNWRTGQCLNTINTDLTIWSLATINSK